jgi:hypothetical protein
MAAFNYIDAHYDKSSNKVIIWTRGGEKNERKKITIPAPHYFYVEDVDGEFTSMYGKPLKKLEFRTGWEMHEEGKQFRQKYESDIQPHEKALMNNYYGVQAPTLNTALLDIEVDFRGSKYKEDHMVRIRKKL